SQLTVKILGNQRAIPIKKTSAGFRMFLEESVLDNISSSIEKLSKLEKVFTQANKMLESGEITTENFEVKMENISTQYSEALR
ncbi:MAG: hypothetical protein AAFO69_07820, partial [Bacteroidota bacterium]